MTWGLTFKASKSTQIYIQMYFTKPILTVHLQYWNFFIPPRHGHTSWKPPVEEEERDLFRPSALPDDARLDDGGGSGAALVSGWADRHNGQ